MYQIALPMHLLFLKEATVRRNIIHLSRRAAKPITFLAILLFVLGVTFSAAIDLKQSTLQAWNTYIQSVISSMDQRAGGQKQFLWVDESPDLLRRVRAGELLVQTRDHDKIPNGLIHHWIGAMFIPNGAMDRVASVFSDYGRYKDFYGPYVVKSSLLSQQDNSENVHLLFMQKAYGVTAAVEADEVVITTKLDANRLCIISNSTRVREIAEYGRPGQHPYPQDQGPGYVWRMFGVTRLEQRDGGVYVEMESIALSRGIPPEFRWLVTPLTEHLPRSLMLQTLKASRDAVNREADTASH
jgi:hypothetical protein